MPIDDATKERLVRMGRQNGDRLSIEQLGREIPVETMTPGEVAAVVETLEGAGIEVDLEDESLKKSRPSVAYERGAGVVDMASPAAPAVSVPGVRPSQHGWEDEGLGHVADHHGHHGSRKAPTWDRGGVDMLPIVTLAAVALILIVVLG